MCYTEEDIQDRCVEMHTASSGNTCICTSRSCGSSSDSSLDWYFIDSTVGNSFYHWNIISGSIRSRDKRHLQHTVTNHQYYRGNPAERTRRKQQINPPGTEVNWLENKVCDKEGGIARRLSQTCPVFISWCVECCLLCLSCHLQSVCPSLLACDVCEWRCKRRRPWPCLGVRLSSCACLSVFTLRCL